VKRVLVLGSTGSIGRQALEVIDRAEDLTACGLACRGRADEMRAQAHRHGIAHTACKAGGGTVLYDPDLRTLIERSEPDVVLNGLVGADGLGPTLTALELGAVVALANKESLVAGGDLVMAAAGENGTRLVPVDSEHSALFQLLGGVDRARVRGAVLTASGGPFRGRSAADLADASVADALAHPTWSMGAKITIDSATLMNKGLELIEAHHLFGMPYERIEVAVHPQSLVHALVRLEDGSLLSHCGLPDMRVPIAHALRWPEPPLPAAPLDLVGVRLDFEAPDEATFRCLPLAREAGRAGGTAPAVLNAANEVAVQAFLAGRIGFLDIASAVEGALAEVATGPADALEAVLAADAAGRRAAEASTSAAAGVGA
jgi:1-deoxy-D-xylulose-5-phosphate reductoisomerase